MVSDTYEYHGAMLSYWPVFSTFQKHPSEGAILLFQALSSALLDCEKMKDLRYLTIIASSDAPRPNQTSHQCQPAFASSNSRNDESNKLRDYVADLR